MLLGLLAASYTTNAKILQGDISTAETMFKAKNTPYPNAVDSAGTAVTYEKPLWTIQNISYIDEDTGYQYVEIINEVEMPITAADYITFHVEFYTGASAPTSGLFRDGFECSLTKQLTTEFWDTTTKDIYVRGADASAAPADDFNNSVELDGQDWILYQGDADRADGDHLCTTSVDTAKGIQCDKIRCIVRRKMVTEDPDDMVFEPGTAG